MVQGQLNNMYSFTSKVLWEIPDKQGYLATI